MCGDALSMSISNQCIIGILLNLIYAITLFHPFAWNESDLIGNSLEIKRAKSEMRDLTVLENGGAIALNSYLACTFHRQASIFES